MDYLLSLRGSARGSIKSHMASSLSASGLLVLNFIELLSRKFVLAVGILDSVAKDSHLSTKTVMNRLQSLVRDRRNIHEGEHAHQIEDMLVPAETHQAFLYVI